jgi:hypothetical protein
MKKLIIILFILLFSSFSLGVEFQSSFNGIQENLCDKTTNIYSIACYDFTIFDENFNIYNLAGENQLSQNEIIDGDNWTRTNINVTANAVKSPFNEWTADIISEDNTPASNHYLSHAVVNYIDSNYPTCVYYVKPINRNWVQLSKGVATNPSAYFDILNGVIGTVNNGGMQDFLPEIKKITGDWYRISISWREAVGPNVNCTLYIADADNSNSFNGLNQQSIAVGGSQLYSKSYPSSQRYNYIPKYTKTFSNDFRNPSMDLNMISLPVIDPRDTFFRYEDSNNRIIREFDGTFYRRSRTTHALKIFDSNNTITMIARINDKINNQALFDCGTDHRNCIRFNWNAGVPSITYKNATGGVIAYFDTNPLIDDSYYLFQAVRNGNELKTYLNGVYFATYDVTGAGIDPVGIAQFALGSTIGIVTDYFNGSILYLKIDQKDLSEKELLTEKEKLTNLLSSRSNQVNWIYNRDSNASFNYFDKNYGLSYDYNNKYLKYFSKNYPRIHGDNGGLLIEEEKKNYVYYSHEFNLWTPIGTANVVSNYDEFIDGLNTSDRLDGSAIGDYIILPFPDTFFAGEIVTFSVFAKNCNEEVYTENRDWLDGMPDNKYYDYSWSDGFPNYYTGEYILADADISIGITEGGFISASASYQLTEEYRRYYYTYLFPVDGSDKGVVIQPGNGITTIGRICINGAQFEHGYQTSYIMTNGDSEIRYRDEMIIPWKNIFVPKIGNSNKYDKLKIEFDLKCEHYSSWEIIRDSLILEISQDGINTENIISFYQDTTGVLVANMLNDLSNVYQVRTIANPVVMSDWNKFRIQYDLSDMTNYNIYINDIPSGVLFTPGTDPTNLNFENAFIRLGSDYSNTTRTNCRYRNLRVEVK